MLKEASTITELHNASDNSEVKLRSLISEQIPQYKLRLDSVLSYDNSDWVKNPVLSPKPYPSLTPEQCEETFKFLILGGIRLSQMTRTYHDIEAVTHLLEEKERDLELAARIGQTLLKKNRDISQYNEKLEEQLANALEEAYQLRHEINLKEDVMLMHSDDETDSSGAPSPIKELRHFGRAAMYSHVESLQAQIFKLKEENADYQKELHRIVTQSEDLECIEQKLVSEAVQELQQLKQELKNAQKTIDTLTNELTCKTDENARQQEEITRLLAQIVDLHKKQKHLAIENEELNQHVLAANNAQLELTKEVKHLEDRYQEVSSMLEETREEVQHLRDYPDALIEKSVPFGDSLAAEIRSSEEVISREPDDFSTPLKKSVQNPEQEIQKFDGVNCGKDLTKKYHSPTLLAKSPLPMKRLMQEATNHGSSGSLLDTPFSCRSPVPLPSSFISSTPCGNRRHHVHASSHDSPKHNSSHNSISSLRLQLANKALAEKVANPVLATSVCNAVSREKCENLSLSSVCKEFSGMKELHSYLDTALLSPIHVRRNNPLLFHSWHGETENGLICVQPRHRILSPSLGRPGIPGTEDLDKAIQKLAMRRETMRYMEMQENVSKRESHLSRISCEDNSVFNSSYGTTDQPHSIFIHSKKLHHKNTPSPKLCIVKPLEGSVTLNQWKYLAKQDSDQSMSVLCSKKSEPAGIIRREHVPEIMSKLEVSSNSLKSRSLTSSSCKSVSSNEPSLPQTSDNCYENSSASMGDFNGVSSPGLLVASTDGMEDNLKTTILKKEVLTSTRYTITDCFVSNLDDEYQHKISDLKLTSPSQDIQSPSLAVPATLSKKILVVDQTSSYPHDTNSMSKYSSELQKISGPSLHSDVVWNKRLQRAFSISPKSPGLPLSLSINRDQKNITTPPNSPQSSPASDFLLNEMMEKSTCTEKVNSGLEKSGFSTNLLAKLSKVGITVFPGLKFSKSDGEASKSTHPSNCGNLGSHSDSLENNKIPCT